VQKPERSIARRERLKAVTEEKLVTSHGKLFQTLITLSEKKTDRVALLQRRLNRDGHVGCSAWIRRNL